jgi:UDP-2,4-diacetamido-2,4,6-trideoxy-beta-L-altropyranose hydrolase
VNIVIRADASRVIGHGHMMRTLSLGRALRSAGAQVTFVSRAHPGNLIPLLQTEGFVVVSLQPPPAAVPEAGGPAHAAWLGADWQQDAADTHAAIARGAAMPDWLIVDHYGIDARWEAAVRPHVGRILVIDDLADRSHDCDLLLDQNLVEDMQQRYQGRVHEECATMLGPRYALLQPIYAQLHEQIAPRSGPIRRILIYFGGSDRHELTPLALRALIALDRADIAADVVVSDSAPAIAQLARQSSQIRVHADLPSLAPLMADADLAIGAAGSTSWERMCLGLPAVVITVADNQQPVARALQQRGLIHWLGSYDTMDEAKLRAALAQQIAAGADTASSRAGHRAVDGRGINRVRTALLAGASTPLRMRAAAPPDEELLLEWANDSITRRYSFGRNLISAAEHHQWFCGRLQDLHNCLLLIAETEEGAELGTVRFDRAAEGWRLNYSLGAPYRGRGLGRRMLELALQRLAQSHGADWVCGRVMAANVPSHRVFRGLGFEAVNDAGGVVEYRRAL